MADVNDFDSDSVSSVALADVPPLIGRGDITSGTTLAALYVIASGHLGRVTPPSVHDRRERPLASNPEQSCLTSRLGFRASVRDFCRVG
jgi:hypothetical protein